MNGLPLLETKQCGLNIYNFVVLCCIIKKELLLFKYDLFLKVFPRIDSICPVLLHICKPVLRYHLYDPPSSHSAATRFPARHFCFAIVISNGSSSSNATAKTINLRSLRGCSSIIEQLPQWHFFFLWCKTFFFVSLVHFHKSKIGPKFYTTNVYNHSVLMLSLSSYTKCGRYMPLK